jgi:ABC-type dipeptide/oligopeptide/nickel transport systems, permease components
MIFWQKFKKQKSAMVAGIFILFLVLAAIFAPFIAPYDPYAIDYGNAMMPPSPQHWAGTDIYGRDILSRIIYGARISLTVGIFLSHNRGNRRCKPWLAQRILRRIPG